MLAIRLICLVHVLLPGKSKHLLKALEMMDEAVLLRLAADGRGILALAAAGSSPSIMMTEPGNRPSE